MCACRLFIEPTARNLYLRCIVKHCLFSEHGIFLFIPAIEGAIRLMTGDKDDRGM